MKKSSTLKYVQTAVLAAIILLMAFTPIGYLRIGPFSLALVIIPVVVGAMSIGILGGTLLGLVFGLSSFAQCFTGDALGVAMISINPFGAFVVCVISRTLMGYLTGLIFKLFRRLDHTNTWCYFVTGLMGALFNTIFFMGTLVLFFWNSEYIVGVRNSLGVDSVFAFILVAVGLNGLVEMGLCCFVGGLISKVLNRVIKKTSDGEYV